MKKIYITILLVVLIFISLGISNIGEVNATTIKDNDYIYVTIPDNYEADDGPYMYDTEFAAYGLGIYSKEDIEKNQNEGYYDYNISVCYIDNSDVLTYADIEFEANEDNKYSELIFEGETVFKGYNAHCLKYKREYSMGIIYRAEYYIYTDNYCYVIDFMSYDENYESTSEYKLIVNSLKIKDTAIKNTGTAFSDVSVNSWYHGAVKYVYDNKIMSGTSTTTFAPSNKLTRGMMATILYNMAGSPAVSGTSPFGDVKDNSKWYYKAVLWASQNKIVNGNKDGTFKPNGNITREELAIMLYNYAKFKGKDLSKTDDLKAFSDSGKVASYAKTAVKWAVANGVITGSGGKLNPKGNATRAEAASMIYKYCDKIGR